MQDLFHDPESFAHRFERHAGSLVSILGWGRRINTTDDHILKLALKMMDDITIAQVPGYYWIEAIPELQYPPAWIYPVPAQLKSFGDAVRQFWWALDCEGSLKERDHFSKTLVRSTTLHRKALAR
jgi:hypothetical protein